MVGQGSRNIEPGAIRDAAAEIFILCFPLVQMDAVRRAHPMALLHQFHLVPADGTSLAPGMDLDDPGIVVSSVWIDLTEGPVVVSLPHMHGRYFSLTAIDTAGEPFACLGSRTGDDTGLDFALVGPDYTGALRRGLRAKRSTSDGCWVISRIHGRSMLDRVDALAIAQRQTLAPEWGQPVGVRHGHAVIEPMSVSSLRQALEIEPATFFHRLDNLLARAPVGFRRQYDPVIAGLLAELGGPSRAADWTPEFREAVGRGFADAVAAIRATAESMEGPPGPRWRPRIAPVPGRAEAPVVRAARVFAGLGAPSPEELLTLICDRDADGRPLWGANVYCLSFAEGALPPVHAFWRLHTRPAVADRRRGVGNSDDLLLNPDGSLDLTIQSGLPQRSAISNWLPAPEGEMTLVMHLNAPRPPALNDAWRMPPVLCVENDPGSGRSARRGASAATASPTSNELQAPIPAGRSIP